MPMRPTIWRRRTGLAIAATLGLMVAASGARPAMAQDAGDAAARLERENASLERLVELARGKEFYLVLDPGAPDLTLMLRGAELRRYPVRSLQVGVPQVAFVHRADPQPWQGVIWSGGTLDPPRELDRLEITPPPAGADEPAEAPVIPPTPEEAYPVPTRYHIRFENGPAIEVRPREADDEAGMVTHLVAWWSARWRDAVAALRAHPAELVRLRVVLAPEDADTLYRSLPPDTKLLVVSGRSGGGGSGFR
jgi:hypothetical protein